ncbi:MAG: Hsp20/alpha crystallin family protein [Sphingomonadaceae bacterium]|uniref:Hsp20/alpha crystallin family protein n=1 Tax=Thermaurantiacus sp. TaxID=2820283 RepID=UPI00298EEF8E|nr:Hsp20/alpha crystallin family protein [Thermaurantiacus sp.]MCS6986191.1 Hsp20/alpha crystallin family protein [Sphingomonadaceae bacterium]MDW8415900.1 Hsp20/alpha crystallin family protein [Thermaurantiacus sp.]
MDLKSLVPFWGSAGLPADPFATMRREMERLFDEVTRGLPTGGGFLTPKVDVVETEEGLEIHAELPGIEANDVDLEIENGVLTLKAETSREREEKDDKRRYHLVERARGTYLRRFQLPFVADEGKIEARFDKGVLTVKVPRAPEARPSARKIRIG